MGKKVRVGSIVPSLGDGGRGEASLLLHMDETTDNWANKSRRVKRVPVPRFSPSSDVESVAQAVVDDCKYLNSSKLELVEHALIQLQSMMLSGQEDDGEATQMEASMNRIDEYIEMMYETEEKYTSKNKGTAKIVQLCSHVSNLEALIQNQSLMQLLSRLLDTEYKKSLEMSYNIVRVFLAFSNFFEMHSLLAQYKVGSMTLKALAFETSRVEQRVRDTEALDEEERRLEVSAVQGERVGDMEAAKALSTFRKKKQKQVNKMSTLKRWSEKLMHVSYYLLLNLAEDVGTEKKMLKKQLVENISIHLKHAHSAQLLIMLTAFLKKLSVMEENVSKIKSLGVVSDLVRLLPCTRRDGQTAVPLANLILGLLFNLSFDKEARDEMVGESLLPKLVTMLNAAPHRRACLQLLYHLSTEDRVKAMFAYTEAVPTLMRMVIMYPKDELGIQLAALVVNLSWNPRIAEMMVHFPRKHEGLYELVARLERTQDPLLMKIIRNLSHWTANLQADLANPDREYTQRGMWGRFVDQLTGLLVAPSTQNDLMVELLGCLGNLTVLDMPRASGWAKVAKKHDLISFLSRLLVPGFVQHDVVLEVVILIGTIVSDPRAVELVASSKLVTGLQDVWQDKQDDCEIVLQTLHTFNALMKHEATREELLYNTRIVVDLLGCVDHRHPIIRRQANSCLDIVLEQDRQANGELGDLGQQICKRRFEAHNAEWLDAMRMDGGFGDFRHGYDDDDDDDLHLGGLGAGLGGAGMHTELHMNRAPGAGGHLDDDELVSGRIASMSMRHAHGIDFDDSGKLGSEDAGDVGGAAS